MSDDYNDFLKKQSEYKSAREDKYLLDSRERLSKILKKKIQTTMIGSLSAVEEQFSFLWVSDGEPTKEQKMMYDLYQDLRSKILDIGNLQMRNVDAELAQYSVKWLRYQTVLPVKKKGE